MKIVDSTQTMRKSLVKHIRARGIPTRPDNKSDVAKEARNMLVGVLSVFFLWIKMITKPFTADNMSTAIAKFFDDRGNLISDEPEEEKKSFFSSILK